MFCEPQGGQVKMLSASGGYVLWNLREGEEEVVGDKCLCYLLGEEKVDAEEEIKLSLCIHLNHVCTIDNMELGKLAL